MGGTKTVTRFAKIPVDVEAVRKYINVTLTLKKVPDGMSRPVS